MSAAPARRNPFPGLRPFTPEEDYVFFGREEQTLELLERLASHRFLAVVGTSGSGKSSLVRCGLLSQLLGGKMLAAGASWEVAVTHPGGNPLALLTEALLEADLYDRQAEHARENLLATLSRSHFGLECVHKPKYQEILICYTEVGRTLPTCWRVQPWHAILSHAGRCRASLAGVTCPMSSGPRFDLSYLRIHALPRGVGHPHPTGRFSTEFCMC